MVGVTGIHSDRPTYEAMEAPDTAIAGTSFTIVVSSFGSTSCTEPAGVEMEVGTSIVVITPYDIVAPEGTPCTQDFGAFPRRVDIRLVKPGEAILRLQGKNIAGETEVLDHRILVQ